MTSTLGDMLAEAATLYPDNTAVIFGDSSLTYGDLHKKAKRLAGSLVASGVGVGAPVGIAIPKSLDAVVAVYGIMLSGACYTPIDPFSSPERASRIAQNINMETIVCTDRFLKINVEHLVTPNRQMHAFVPDPGKPVIADGLTLHSWDDDTGSDFLPKISTHDIAYILHTSGSTGIPKGVTISHKSALTFVEMAAKFFSITHHDTLCSQAPLHFDLSVFDFFVACSRHAPVVVFPEHFNAFPRKMIEAIDRHKISIWNSVVSALTQLLESGESDPDRLNSIRIVLFSGETMPVQSLRQIRASFRNARLFNGYGQTEANTSMYFEVRKIPGDEEWRLPIGNAFPNYDVFAIGDDGMPIECSDIAGELYVSSDAVADGYWNDPELTAAKFVDDPRQDVKTPRKTFRTGDRVMLDSDFQYHFLGRKDNMIKSRGFRIELGEVEYAILLCNGVVACTCVAIPDDLIGNRIQAFVCLADDTKHSTSKILEHCREVLPHYMVPAQIAILGSMPMTPTGKVDRQALIASL